jgi:crossover junction endodeoxyribonuclease RuvC
MCIEQLYFGRNTTTAGYVWQARGTILLLASQYDLRYYEPKPNQIKMAVCGSGSADKKQVQKMVQRLLNLKELPRPDDAADALAISLTGLALESFSRKTGSAGNVKKS